MAAALAARHGLSTPQPAVPAEVPTVRPDPMGAGERADWNRAANIARRRYLGPVGELLAREIEASLAFSYRVDHTCLIARVVAELLNGE